MSPLARLPCGDLKFLATFFYSTVYKCKSPNGNDCCIKKISLNRSSAEMIQKEIFLLVNLQHPRIIQLHSHFTILNDNHVYIVMEYATEGALSKYLAERRNKVRFLSQKVMN